MSPDRNAWLPIASILTAMLLWSSTLVALKFVLLSYNPMLVVFGCTATSSLCFLVFFSSKFKSITYKAGDWKWLLLMAFFEPCLYNIFETWSLTNTTASQGGMFEAMQPLMVAVAGMLMLKEKVTAQNLLGLAVAISGAVWLSLAGEASEYAPRPVFGNFLYFLAMVCSAGYTIILKKLSSRYPAVFLTALQSFAGAIFFFPAIFVHPAGLPEKLTLVPVLVILYIGVISHFGAYSLYNFGVSRIPASRAAAFINLIPIFTIALGWLCLGETFTPFQYLASGLVFLGVYLSQRRKSAQKAAVPLAG